jgi:hypothetical protein
MDITVSLTDQEVADLGLFISLKLVGNKFTVQQYFQDVAEREAAMARVAVAQQGPTKPLVDAVKALPQDQLDSLLTTLNCKLNPDGSISKVDAAVVANAKG